MAAFFFLKKKDNNNCFRDYFKLKIVYYIKQKPSRNLPLRWLYTSFHSLVHMVASCLSF